MRPIRESMDGGDSRYKTAKFSRVPNPHESGVICSEDHDDDTASRPAAKPSRPPKHEQSASKYIRPGVIYSSSPTTPPPSHLPFTPPPSPPSGGHLTDGEGGREATPEEGYTDPMRSLIDGVVGVISFGSASKRPPEAKLGASAAGGRVTSAAATLPTNATAAASDSDDDVLDADDDDLNPDMRGRAAFPPPTVASTNESTRTRTRAQPPAVALGLGIPPPLPPLKTIAERLAQEEEEARAVEARAAVAKATLDATEETRSTPPAARTPSAGPYLEHEKGAGGTACTSSAVPRLVPRSEARAARTPSAGPRQEYNVYTARPEQEKRAGGPVTGTSIKVIVDETEVAGRAPAANAPNDASTRGARASVSPPKTPTVVHQASASAKHVSLELSEKVRERTSFLAMISRGAMDNDGDGTVSCSEWLFCCFRLGWALKVYVKLPLLSFLSRMRFLDVYFRFLFPLAYIPAIVWMFDKVPMAEWEHKVVSSSCFPSPPPPPFPPFAPK